MPAELVTLMGGETVDIIDGEAVDLERMGFFPLIPIAMAAAPFIKKGAKALAKRIEKKTGKKISKVAVSPAVTVPTIVPASQVAAGPGAGLNLKGPVVIGGAVAAVALVLFLSMKRR